VAGVLVDSGRDVSWRVVVVIGTLLVITPIVLGFLWWIKGA
jgi:hypothetical protein